MEGSGQEGITPCWLPFWISPVMFKVPWCASPALGPPNPETGGEVPLSVPSEIIVGNPDLSDSLPGASMTLPKNQGFPDRTEGSHLQPPCGWGRQMLSANPIPPRGLSDHFHVLEFSGMSAPLSSVFGCQPPPVSTLSPVRLVPTWPGFSSPPMPSPTAPCNLWGRLM